MKVFRFFTVPVEDHGQRELRWKWEDSTRHEEAAREFIDLNRCIEDARRHGFLAEHEDEERREDEER